MTPEELRDQICKKYSIKHVESEAIMEDNNFYSMDGINEQGTFYIAARLSDGHIRREAIDNFEGIELLTKDGKKGVISELRAEGASWRDIFFETMNNPHLPKKTIKDFD
ncbi:hypothetical protein GF343_00445 [Candidatus Woesearchaeota archaeon]|nr:hypothetical protein [Candidatus Woesearchaeota archaeon]